MSKALLVGPQQGSWLMAGEATASSIDYGAIKGPPGSQALPRVYFMYGGMI